MKKFENNIFQDIIELPVIFQVAKYKTDRVTKQLILDETNQPITVKEIEIDIKHKFFKNCISIVSQTFSDAGKPDSKTCEIFETTSSKSYRIRMSYNKLADLLKKEDKPLTQIGFRYKYKK